MTLHAPDLVYTNGSLYMYIKYPCCTGVHVYHNNSVSPSFIVAIIVTTTVYIVQEGSACALAVLMTRTSTCTVHKMTNWGIPSCDGITYGLLFLFSAFRH